MKKIIAILAILCMLATLIACTDQDKEPNKTPGETHETLEPGYYEGEEATFPSIPLN